MSFSRRFSLVGLLAVAAMTGSGVQTTYSPQASASEVSGSSTSGDTGGQIAVSVSVEYSTAGSGGGGGAVTSSSSTSVSVKPSCGYSPGRTGAEQEEFLNTHPKSKNQRRRLQNMTNRTYVDYEQHKGDSSGRWWLSYCDSEAFPDDNSFSQALKTFHENNPPSIWVPDGQSAPAPYIAGSTLAKAAWEAVSIPAPTVETNPKVGDRGATLVGMDTWVWATGETPTSVTATATAGGTSATVTAGSAGLQLSAPDGRASCTGFGIPWHRGMPEGSSPCTISFNRSSAHLGGTTPLSVKVAYSASYTGSDGSSGTLPAITTTSTVDLPVAEVQTLTTNNHHNNPRQN